ncbi:rhamnogalacturonan acetylesterase [Aegicerativicinus sediminis]|uniref:rhamnogalacturonan acetylesterase n=1 Tax=Aegicerativicinus sediminis TaxID=2893202 RepID=UPI001E4BE090|nr:rhamnogalacturonan acetylesterase [Aegicerativicinus sediminis]
MKPIQLIIVLLLMVLTTNCQKEPYVKPTVFLVGDSTVKNGKGDGAGGLWGWGDFIGQYLDTTKVSVENHALGGTSSRTYQNLGLWDSVYHRLKKGDYVLIQFGHNDNGPVNDTFRARGTIKGIGDETEEIDNLITKKHEIVHSYGWYIKKIAEQTKEKGAIPIIMSPIPRNIWTDGKVPRNNQTYGLWSKQIAKITDATIIDLNSKMADTLEQFGEEKVTDNYFYSKDHTHTSAAGAVLAASIIINGISKTSNSLKKYVIEKPQIHFPKRKNLFLIGDSTMAENGNENAVGWGVPFPKYIDTFRVKVINKARGGRSSRTFIDEGLWDDALSEFQKGDFVLIQFGHNDAGNIDKEKYRGSLNGIGEEIQNVKRDSLIETVHTYGWYLSKMIDDTRSEGATPIILSFTPRNEWPGGKVERRNDTYVKWAEEVASNKQVSFLDVHNLVAEKYEELGIEKVKPFFPKDHTHTNLNGAEFTAFVIANAIKTSREIGLGQYIQIKK